MLFKTLYDKQLIQIPLNAIFGINLIHKFSKITNQTRFACLILLVLEKNTHVIYPKSHSKVSDNHYKFVSCSLSTAGGEPDNRRKEDCNDQVAKSRAQRDVEGVDKGKLVSCRLLRDCLQT